MKRYPLLALSIVTCVLMLFSSCTFRRVELPSGVSTEFFWMPPKQQEVEFEKYDFESQYKIYIYGNQHIEPPEMGLTWTFAREGGKIVKRLAAKLENTNDDVTIENIVRVFEVMNDLGSYDVAGNKALMQEMLEKVSAMKDPTWQIITQQSLWAIKPKEIQGLSVDNFLRSDPQKFDDTNVGFWGRVKFDEGVAYFTTPDSKKRPSEMGVCLDATGSMKTTSPLPWQTLKALDDQVLVARGIYQASGAGRFKNCRNGVLHLKSVEISFE